MNYADDHRIERCPDHSILGCPICLEQKLTNLRVAYRWVAKAYHSRVHGELVTFDDCRTGVCVESREAIDWSLK